MRLFALTDIGKVRKENQDAWRVCGDAQESELALVVCDGMGGANAGGTASTLASECFTAHVLDCLQATDRLPPDAIVRDAAAYANLRLYDHAFSDADCRGMGTTLVGGLFLGRTAAIVNVGDSRAYLLRSGTGLRRVTEDHSLVAELVAAGKLTAEQARNHPRRNVITRALGMDSEIRSDVFPLTLESGDRLLFCTDGLSNQIEDFEIEEILRQNAEPEGCCRALLDTALERGAPDNVTAAVLFAD